jgi:hypothetical protein
MLALRSNLSRLPRPPSTVGKSQTIGTQDSIESTQQFTKNSEEVTSEAREGSVAGWWRQFTRGPQRVWAVTCMWNLIGAGRPQLAVEQAVCRQLGQHQQVGQSVHAIVTLPLEFICRCFVLRSGFFSTNLRATIIGLSLSDTPVTEPRSMCLARSGSPSRRELPLCASQL